MPQIMCELDSKDGAGLTCALGEFVTSLGICMTEIAPGLRDGVMSFQSLRYVRRLLLAISNNANQMAGVIDGWLDDKETV